MNAQNRAAIVDPAHLNTNAGEGPGGNGPVSAQETAAYIMDMAKALAELAREQELLMLDYLLGMVAQEAGETCTGGRAPR